MNLRQNVASGKSLKWVRVSSLWTYRVLTWGVLAAGFAFAAAVLGMRYWILPNVGEYRADIERVISEAAGRNVEIGDIRANWDGLRPKLVFERVRVLDAEGRPALELPRVDNTVSWLSLLTLQLRFYALDIHRPTLEVRRDPAGRISVAGVALSGGLGGNEFAGWLLRQRDIEIIDATVAWTDEERGAPRIEFRHVNLHMINRGSHHRFGLQAMPPSELAAPLDLRGDVVGDGVESLAKWNGRLFLQLEYVDIAAWRQWISFPVRFPRGQGALRAWLSFSDRQLTGATADVHLVGVRTQLAQDLPELDLTELSGRIGWKSSREGIELTTSKLAMTTTGGLKLHPSNLRLRMVAGARGAALQGDFQVDELNLEPVVALADHLPLGDEARRQLARFSPRGGLRDVAVRWRGPWQKPVEYSVKGRFAGLALGHVEKMPGFRGISGTVEASESGGSLYVNSQKVAIDMPALLRQPLQLDALTAHVRWERLAGETEVRFNSVSFSNAHAAGAFFGRYRTMEGTRGHIDLTGRLTRAEARHLPLYIPLTISKGTREWLDTAVIAGESTDVSLRVKGDLDDFPFEQGSGGIFQVVAKVTGGTLDYATGWPRIENLSGDVVFRGKRMDINARRGTVFGVALERVRVEIPDLVIHDELLRVAGQAQGPTGDFLAFIEKSPVNETIGRFTEGWQATGAGSLELKLEMPLRALPKSKVGGVFRFDRNTIRVHSDVPPVEQASGRVEFTESSVVARDVRGHALGGPVTITTTSKEGETVLIGVNGRIDTDKMQGRKGQPDWVQHVRGSTDWRASITVRGREADIVAESGLKGMAVYLPPPLLKPPAETWPLRLERRSIGQGDEHIGVDIAKILSVKLVRRTEGTSAAIPRGVVSFGGAAAEPQRDGIWVNGTVPALDVDGWLALLGRPAQPVGTRWGGIDLKLGSVDALGRRYTDLAIHAVSQADGTWRSSLVGKEFEGTVLWQPQGRGRLTARMKRLAIPAPSPATLQAPAEAAQGHRDLELPALDITAEEFALSGNTLGSLEVAALPEGSDWRIERLQIVNPESTFTLDGVWQGWLAAPRTRVNIRLDAKDAGKLLNRLGYPEGLKRGTAKLEGTLNWQGSPYSIDYPTLSGHLVLDAQKGQFDKINPGVGKLLGVVSLQSLPRRVSLDFRDVFSDGFAFDEIVGPVKIEHGIAVTDNFKIQGPSARVVMKGKVDLARETQDLRVRVTPYLSESVSIAGALIGGPVAGVATFLAQKMLKDPIDTMAAFEYDVTGSWKDPQVSKVPLKSQVDRESTREGS
ncbi:MAG TPA: YhdP family protein [Burkholderiales bacterium]|nr:YhdP family protein [Burkholderiales bacterium]